MTMIQFLSRGLKAVALGSVIVVAAVTPATASVTATCSTAGGVNCGARIPDAVGAVTGTVTSTMTVAGCPTGVTVSRVNVMVNISHTWIGDLQVTVSNPGAGTATLMSNLPDPTGSPAGCQGDNVSATFRDGAASQSCSAGVTGEVAPVTSLAAFATAPVAGTWTLTVSDTQNSSDGALNDWAVIALCMTLDIDANRNIDGLTDGLILLRYLFGIIGPALTADATAPNATRTDPGAVKLYLDQIRPMLDVDGNGNVDALTDGILILRYILGLRGDALIGGAIGPNATRTTAPAIEEYIATSLMQ